MYGADCYASTKLRLIDDWFSLLTPMRMAPEGVGFGCEIGWITGPDLVRMEA